jgi:hypothetical protein
MVTIADLVEILATLPDVRVLYFRRYGVQLSHDVRAAALHADRGGELLDSGSRDIAVHKISAHSVAEKLPLLVPEVGEAIALSSLVETVHGPRHLLLLDFACPPSPEVQAELSDFLTRAGLHGWLLMSGNSYHFVGIDLLTHADWTRGMGRALLMPGIDVRYIGHRLNGGMGGLRMTAHPLKPTVPFVVEAIGLDPGLHEIHDESFAHA